ncbi:MAG: hypothetical protein L3J51_07615 [Cocleimonas sp.]|nr:hypothetical protein [Cocleimonas sp.]
MTYRTLASAFILTLISSFPSNAFSTLYEDAEDGDTQGNVPPNVRGWFKYDDTPAGASITNVYDADKGSRVIQFNGAPNSGSNNGYALGDWYPTSAGTWNNTSEFNLHWCSRYSEFFVVYLRVYTTDSVQFVYNGNNYNTNQRYIYYTPSTGSSWNANKVYNYHGLSTPTDGQWKSFNRDLQADLHEFEPNNNITSVVAFLIRGSGKVDDIILSQQPQKPKINLQKTQLTVYDPVNGLSNPKAIPGSIKEYTLKAQNFGFQAADNNTTVLQDNIPTNMKLCVANTGHCKKPYLVTATNTSGMNIGSVLYTVNGVDVANPPADADGYNAQVTKIKIAMTGEFPDMCSGSHSFEIKFRTGLK